MFSVTLRCENTCFLKVACRLTGTPGASLLRARPSPRCRGPEAHRLQRTRAPSGGQVPSSRWPRLNARGPRAGPRGCHGAEESDFSERLCGHRPHSRFLCVSSFTPEWGCIAHLRGAQGALGTGHWAAGRASQGRGWHVPPQPGPQRAAAGSGCFRVLSNQNCLPVTQSH